MQEWQKHIVSHAIHFRDNQGRVTRLIGTCRDITAEEEGHQTLKDARERAFRQQSAFAKIAVDRPTPDILQTELQWIAKIAAETLEVERVGVWLLSEDQDVLDCVELYVASTGEHSSNIQLASADYPQYWQAIRTNTRINAHNALQDARVAEFRDGYLIPLGISSMLDAAITVDDALAGVICIEHTGPMRIWHPDEEAFATSIGSIIAQMLVSDQRQEMEREYRRLIDYVSAGVVVHAPDTTITSCNWMAAHILELEEDRVEGADADDPAWKFVKEDGTPMPQEDFPVVKVLKTLSPVDDYVVGILKPNGKTTWCLTRAYPAFMSNGDLKEVVVTFVDITRQREATEGLRESEIRNRLIVENAPYCIHEIDLDGRMVSINKTGMTMLNIENESDILGIKYIDLAAEDHRPRINSLMQAAFSGKASEFEVRGVNGRAYTSSFVPIYDDHSSRVVRLMGMSVDITDRLQASLEREQLQLQLSHALKMEAVGQLAGGIAHDFNNLLHVMKVYGEFAREEADEESEQYRYLRESEKAVDRATVLVSQLLAFSRRQVLQMEDVDLNTVIAESVEMLRHVIGRHIDFQLKCSDDHALVHVDPGQVSQILINLCTNARDAMPDGGVITIGVQRVTADNTPGWLVNRGGHRQFVILTVEDNGHGMDLVTQNHIFEPFFTTKDVGKGTGLGLSTVYGLIQQHHGEIHVESEENHGTTFLIAFPAVDVAEQTAGVQRSASSVSGSETILLAEDEDAIRETSTQILSEAGYQVLTAADGRQAVEVFTHHVDEIDLVLLDVIMPGMSGRVAYERIHELRPNLPVLFASGFSDSATETNFVSRHGHTLLQKPFSRDSLLHHIRRSLDEADSHETKSSEKKTPVNKAGAVRQ